MSTVQNPTKATGTYEIEGELIKEIFRNDSDFCILSIRTDGQGGKPIDMCVLGTLPPDYVVAGLRYRFSGKWKYSDKYGRQLKFEFAVQLTPHGRHGIVTYLKKYVSGIGPTIAERLYDEFGSETINKLKYEPEACSEAVNGLTLGAALKASDKLLKTVGLEETKIDLLEIFKNCSVQKQSIHAILDKWGASAPEVCRNQTFELLTHRTPGIGFTTADKIFTENGGDPSDIERQVWYLWSVCSGKQHLSGDHTWYRLAECHSGIEESIGDVTLDLRAAVQRGIDAEILATREVDGEYWLTTYRKAEQESDVSHLLAKLIGADAPVSWPDPATIENVSDHQREALVACFSGRVAILKGLAGVGKSHVVAATLKTLIASGEGSIAFAAPTGKASVRLTEAMQEYGLGVEATTIHRLLAPQYDDKTGEFKFFHGPHEPLPFKFVVIDEFSMVSLSLFRSLLRALRPGTHLLLVGDTNQLMPIEHGCPMRDMLRAGIAAGSLTEIRRNAGRGVEISHAVTRGEPFEDPGPRLEPSDNVVHHECKDNKEAAVALRTLIENAMAAGVDPIWDTLVICPSNKYREFLNTQLQQVINPHTKPLHEKIEIKVGDRVICKKNTMMGIYSGKRDGKNAPIPDGDTFIANGEMGVVSDFWKDSKGKMHLLVEFRTPARTVFVSGDDVFLFQLAWAITVHASQGSQARFVFYMIDETAGRIGSRGLVYTAITRFQEMLITIGRAATLNAHIRRDVLKKRKTFLTELLKLELPALEAK